MHKFILSFLGLGLVFQVAAQPQIKNMDTQIEEVTVFLDGAQIFRTGKTQLQAGRSELVVKGLSSLLDPSSIVVRGKGNFTVLGVENSNNYFTLTNDSIQFLNWQNKQEELEEKVAKEDQAILVYSQEKTALDQAMELRNTQTVQKSLEVKDLVDFFRNRSFEIYQKIEECQKRKKALNEELTKLVKQMEGSNLNNPKYSTEVRILVNADQGGTAEILLSYVVRGASWHPEYDIRVNEVNKPMVVKSKAVVVQNTAENWKEVQLTLSTGSPNKSAIKPILNPYYLNYYSNSYGGYLQESKALSNTSPAPAAYLGGLRKAENASLALYEKQAKQKAEMRFDQGQLASTLQVSQTEGATNTSFEIKMPYSIPSDGKNHMVEIGETAIPAEYQYQAVPKLDKEAFLVAQVVDWEKYDLMQANANIFLEGTFTGRTVINPGNPGDTLSLTLGRDKGILIKREKVKDYSKNQSLGTDKKVERKFDISIRNNKKEAIKLVLEDQIPVSQNAEIEVEALDLSGAELDEATGHLKWELNLEPSKEQRIKFGYKMKYPKNASIRIE
jgi:uncharacterized protein (TIGR02231 family)